MRGDTAVESELDDRAENAATATHTSVCGERRPSIVALQNMLKKVSQSPFHSQYKEEFLSGLSAAAPDVTDGQQLHSAQNGWKMEDSHLVPAEAQNGVQDLLCSTPQNGVNGDLAKTNPFYNYLELGGEGHVMEEAAWKTSGFNLDTIFAPPPEFHSSPLDLQPETKTVENGAQFSEPQTDLFQALTHNRTQALFQTSTLAQDASDSGHFHDITLNSPNVFKPVPAQAQNVSSKSLDLLNKEQAARGEDLFCTELTSEMNLAAKSPSVVFDPIKSPSNMEDDLFRSPPVATNPFYTAVTNEADLFQRVPPKSEELFHIKENKPDQSLKEDFLRMSSQANLDLFSPSSANTIDPFPSPIMRDLFQDFSSSDDPFGTSKQNDPFQDVSNGTPDIFQPLPPKTDRRDIFQMPPSNTTSKPTYSTPLFSGPPETRLAMRSPSDLLTATQPGSHPHDQPKSSDGPRDIVLTTPRGTTRDILQMTPFTQARSLSVSPSPSPQMTHVPTFKRPPKPLPRTRPPRKEKPPRPEKPPKPEKPPTPVNDVQPEPIMPKTPPKPAPRPPPKPVIPCKPKTPENKPINPESYVVFEDILFIGQERCVEDWPEDSPELDPDFKPSGRLRLRRESMKTKADSDAGSGEDQDGTGTHSKKKDRKFRLARLTRRESAEKCDDTKEGKSRTLSNARKSSKENFPDVQMFAGENEDLEQNGTERKKKHLKTRVSKLLRRASTTSSMLEGNHANGHLPHESKPQQDDNLNKASGKKPSIRRWSEGTVLDHTSGEEEEEEEEEEGGDARHEQKQKKKMKIKFVPHRGFAITVEKHHLQTDEKLKGAYGYTPRKGSKDKSQDDILGARGYTPRKKSQDDADEEIQSHRLQSTSKAAFMDDEHIQPEKTLHMTARLNGDEGACGMDDCKPKKTTKMKLLHMVRRSPKEDMLDECSIQKKKNSLSAEELDLGELNGTEDCKPKTSRYKGPPPIPRKPKAANGLSDPVGSKEASCADFDEDDFRPGEMDDSGQDEVESCKPRRPLKIKGFRKHKAKSKSMDPECEDPPGATCSDYLSEAAKAEWLAAQKDEQGAAGLEDDDEEGDTDSLMEWWCTVEQWDEVPSDEEDKIIKEDESKSFTVLANKVHRGLRVFNKVFTERAEVLWQSILMLHAIADDISNFHHKAKIAGITGGTTTAVGGVTAIAGLALAPFTFGASLLVTAVGVGVATAGGITSASAAISDNVNNMHERKKVETVLQAYEAHLMDIGKILHFVNQGLYKLRGHPFLRSGTQHYAQDWEVRRAVQMISLVDSPVMRAVEITDAAITSVKGLFTGMDKYFIKDSRELKKGCKKEMVGQIKEVANVLNDGIVELNAIREELQDATGNI